MRAVVYTRVSSEMQLDGYSLEVQEEVCRKFIAAKGWEFVNVYTDPGISAKTTNRPAFQQMLVDAEARWFDTIVIHKLDRFSRSVIDMLLTMRNLEKRGVAVASATEDFDFTSPIGRILLTLLAAFAEWYLTNLAAETKKGHKARVAKGKAHGAIPYGYYRDSDDVTHIDEVQAQAVKIAFEMYATGNHSATEVAEELNLRGFDPPGLGKRKDARRAWTKDTVANMLQNRAYCGYVRYLSEWKEGLHEPIISEALFEQVEAARYKRTVVKGRKPIYHIYLCSRLAWCAECQNSMRATSSGFIKREGGKLGYYTCDPRARQTGCSASAVRADLIDEQIGALLCKLKLPEDWQAESRKRVPTEAGDMDTEKLRAQKRKAKRQLDRLKQLFLYGDLGDLEYREQRDQLRSEVIRIDARLSSNNPIQLQKAADLIAAFPTLWDAATPKERQSLVRSVVDKVWLNENGLDRVEIKPVFRQLLA